LNLGMTANRFHDN